MKKTAGHLTIKRLLLDVHPGEFELLLLRQLLQLLVAVPGGRTGRPLLKTQGTRQHKTPAAPDTALPLLSLGHDTFYRDRCKPNFSNYRLSFTDIIKMTNNKKR